MLRTESLFFWLCLDGEMKSISDLAKSLVSQTRGTIIIGDMKEFTQTLCSMTGRAPIVHNDCTCSINWQSHIKKYIGNLPSSMRERFVARICLEANMLPQAINAYSMAIKNESSRRQKARNSVNLAFVHYMLRKPLETRNIAKQALYFALASKDARSVAHAYNSLGLSYLDGTPLELTNAYNYFKMAANIHHSLANNGKQVNRNLRGNAQSLNNLGLVCMKIHKQAEAKQSFKTSIELKQKLGDLIGVAISSCSLALIECEEGAWKEGQIRFNKAMNTLTQFSKINSVGYFKGKMGSLYARTGNLTEAEYALKEAISIYKAVNISDSDLCEYEDLLSKLKRSKKGQVVMCKGHLFN
ncbi:MAG: tetratricopeptide repeat protein [Desulfobacteraceae bacterium]|nr:tetratricopeptide repeat protein [Desulfobacteraceae bacterium]